MKPFDRFAVKDATKMMSFLLNKQTKLVMKRLTGEYQTVTDIWMQKPVTEQSVISQILKGLRRWDLVLVERVGKNRCYKLDMEQIAKINDISKKLAAFYTPDLVDDSELLTPPPLIAFGAEN